MRGRVEVLTERSPGVTATERKMLRDGWKILRTKTRWGNYDEYTAPPAAKEPTDLDLRLAHLRTGRLLAELRYMAGRMDDR
jgi:hypothetical protein